MVGLNFGQCGLPLLEGAGAEEEMVGGGGFGEADDGFEADAAVGACEEG